MTDWEKDERPFHEVLKSWHRLHDWTRDQAAAELRITGGMYAQYCSKKPCAREASLRRLMTLIDEDLSTKTDVAESIRRAVEAVLVDKYRR